MYFFYCIYIYNKCILCSLKDSDPRICSHLKHPVAKWEYLQTGTCIGSIILCVFITCMYPVTTWDPQTNKHRLWRNWVVYSVTSGQRKNKTGEDVMCTSVHCWILLASFWSHLTCEGWGQRTQSHEGWDIVMYISRMMWIEESTSIHSRFRNIKV